MIRTLSLCIAIGAATIWGGYTLSHQFDRQVASTGSTPHLRVLQASPIDTEELQKFRKGLGFNP